MAVGRRMAAIVRRRGSGGAGEGGGGRRGGEVGGYVVGWGEGAGDGNEAPTGGREGCGRVEAEAHWVAVGRRMAAIVRRRGGG